MIIEDGRTIVNEVLFDLWLTPAPDSKLNWVTQDRQLRECYFRFHRFARISDFTPFFVFSYKGNRKHNIIILCMRYLKSSAYWHLACDVVLYLIMRIKCQERRCSCVGDGVNCQRAALLYYIHIFTRGLLLSLSADQCLQPASQAASRPRSRDSAFYLAN